MKRLITLIFMLAGITAYSQDRWYVEEIVSCKILSYEVDTTYARNIKICRTTMRKTGKSRYGLYVSTWSSTLGKYVRYLASDTLILEVVSLRHPAKAHDGKILSMELYTYYPGEDRTDEVYSASDPYYFHIKGNELAYVEGYEGMFADRVGKDKYKIRKLYLVREGKYNLDTGEYETDYNLGRYEMQTRYTFQYK